MVRVGAAVAALGSLLALILGVSRTTLAMARDRHLPHVTAAVHPRSKVPHRAELAVGAVVAVLAATTDVRGAIGFSSFGVLAYYAIANASALTLTRDEGRPARIVPVTGTAGCLVLACALPFTSAVGSCGDGVRCRRLRPAQGGHSPRLTGRSGYGRVRSAPGRTSRAPARRSLRRFTAHQHALSRCSRRPTALRRSRSDGNSNPSSRSKISFTAPNCRPTHSRHGSF